MDIIIDTVGQPDLVDKDRLVYTDDDDDDDSDDGLNIDNTVQPTSKGSQTLDIGELYVEESKTEKKTKVISDKDFDLDEFENDMGWKKIPGSKRNLLSVAPLKKDLTPVEKVLEKSAIKPGFEKLENIPPYEESLKVLRKKRRLEREKTKGKEWFNMPATEQTDEIKHDLEVIQMRSVLNPKHFYKKNDLKVLPKYFQVGKVVDSPLDYYSGRLTKKERKRTIVDELMADAEFSKYNKRKYKEIIDEKKKSHYKAHSHAKKLKRKKNK